MTETAHTPTWVAIQDAGYWRVVFSDDDATVAYIANGPDQEKHARLMAAAPAMLAALKVVRAHFIDSGVSESDWLVTMLTDAISAATPKD